MKERYSVQNRPLSVTSVRTGATSPVGRGFGAVHPNYICKNDTEWAQWCNDNHRTGHALAEGPAFKLQFMRGSNDTEHAQWCYDYHCTVHAIAVRLADKLQFIGAVTNRAVP